MEYDLIGIDLDGTLLVNGDIPFANLAAVKRAQEAGAMVVPCTGRGWWEASPVLSDVPGLEMGVYVTGAMVAEIDTGQSLDFSVIEPHLAHELVTFLADQPEAVLVYREHNKAGHEYLVTGRGRLTANTRWWFEVTGAAVHFQRDVTPADLHNSLRVGMVASGDRVPGLRQALRQAFGNRILVHSFAALPDPDSTQSVHILEVFPAGVNKWHGLSWIARTRGIDQSRVAAIGDEINDLAMLRRAGCGIAMGNAIPDLKNAARHVTEPNDQDGLAHAINRLLTGQWD